MYTGCTQFYESEGPILKLSQGGHCQGPNGECIGQGSINSSAV